MNKVETNFEIEKDVEDNDSNHVELIIFQVSECYVYMIPTRTSAASYRADEWDVNKWTWEGRLKVVTRGEECVIRLEDKTTGELYARAFLRDGEPHPVEPVTDSSRYFVLRVHEDIGGRVRHAFIGIGFRERPQAYDFQAALHDHIKYLNKRKAAEEMEQRFQGSVDYSLKQGETLVLQIKNVGSSSPHGSSSPLSATPTAVPPLPPPPQSPTAAAVAAPDRHDINDPAVVGIVSADDDFGDFQTARNNHRS